MKKNSLLLLVFFGIIFGVCAQSTKNIDVKLGMLVQKTQNLYFENGIGADFTSEFLLNKQLHLKASYLTSRLGSAMLSNALKQDNILLGADWRFRSEKDLQIFAGINAGVFLVDYGNTVFNVLPKTSTLLSVETGLVYNFKFPVSATLSVGYNLKSGNGIDVPGSLFPVFYKLGLFYIL